MITMIFRFNLSPGALAGKQYCDNKYRIFEVKNVWSGYPGGAQRVDLLEVEIKKIHKIKIATFTEYLTNKQLVEI